MKKIYFLSLSLLFIAFSGFSQTKLNPWSIGVHAGSQQYNGEMGNQFFKFSDHYSGLAGFSFERYLTNHFDLSLDVTLGDIKFSETTPEDVLESYNYDLYQANLHVKYNILGSDDHLFRPYIFAGIGIMQFRSSSISETNLATPAAGLGVNYMLNENVKIRYQNTLLLSDYDGIDNRVEGGNDSYLQTTLGVFATIVGTQDADHDGVSDKNDKCPGTIPGTKVNKEGCAIDRDSDGVMNEDDKCPDLAGKVELAGCPDSDNDGIADSEDSCPQLAGSKELGGCPDSDNDGIADNVDKCPDEAGVTEREGCPEPIDVKNMGMYTYNKLPLKNGTLVIFDENGVPVDTVLTDANGIFNYTQLDPDKNYTILPINYDGDDENIDIYLVNEDGEKTVGTTKRDDGKFVFSGNAMANNDKPKETKATNDKPKEVKKETKVDLPKEVTSKPKVEPTKPKIDDTDLIKVINFSSSSSTINIKYYKKLDMLAAFMKENPNLNLTINGYADNTGSLAFNERLSQNRADRAKSYLVRKGIKAEKITASGKGISNPKASNDTAEGKATNRRSEFILK